MRRLEDLSEDDLSNSKRDDDEDELEKQLR